MPTNFQDNILKRKEIHVNSSLWRDKIYYLERNPYWNSSYNFIPTPKKYAEIIQEFHDEIDKQKKQVEKVATDKKEWVEKCPSCGEEFLKHRGGIQCQSSCSAFILQEEHERILPSMVDYALPQYWIAISCPKDWDVRKEGVVGVSQPFASPPWLKIPWYTLRIKSTFFDTTVHELGHISSIHARIADGSQRFSASQRRTIRKYMPWASKWSEEQSKFRKDYRIKNKLKWFENHPKYKAKIDYFWEQHQSSQGGHYEDAWQSEYERLHGKLMFNHFDQAIAGEKQLQPKNMIICHDLATIYSSITKNRLDLLTFLISKQPNNISS